MLWGRSIECFIEVRLECGPFEFYCLFVGRESGVVSA